MQLWVLFALIAPSFFYSVSAFIPAQCGRANFVLVLICVPPFSNRISSLSACLTSRNRVIVRMAALLKCTAAEHKCHLQSRLVKGTEQCQPLRTDQETANV